MSEQIGLPANKNNFKMGSMDNKSAALGTVLQGISLLVLFLSVHEVVFRDFIFGANSQIWIQLLSFGVIGMALILQLLYGRLAIPLSSIIVWSSFSAFLLLAFTIHETVVFSLVLQPTFIFVLTVLFANPDFISVRKWAYRVALLICILPLVSFVVHFFLPVNVLIRDFFTDGKHVHQNLVFLSFSPSIYYVGGIAVARLSSIFDEPGTFGFFVSIFGSALYLARKERLALFVFICGITSFSTAYLLFLVVVFPLLFGNTLKKYRILIFIILGGLVFFILQFVPEVVRFLSIRLGYAFRENHNRTEGWQVSIEAIMNMPLFGGMLKNYSERAISASGILVFMAYIGIPATLLLLGLIIGQLVRATKKMGYSFENKKGVVVFFAALAMTIANRNNMFNLSGYVMVLFAVIAGSVFVVRESDETGEASTK